jgi:uncharacterized protein YbaR (Trm112 family)
VHGVSTALEIPEPERVAEPDANDLMRRLLSDAPTTSRFPGTLVGGAKRSPKRLVDIYWCPICRFRLKKTVAVCPECGADLEFYATLSKSQLGKRLISGKEKRKLRYGAIALRKY